MNPNKPTFSVVTPTYNCAEFILRSYFCLQSQTFTDWEWIIVDDGSSDDTFEILKSINDPRVRPFRYEKNSGRGYARDYALKQARGKWMVVWDVDDIFLPERLSEAAQARKEGFEFCCSYAFLLSEKLELNGLRTFVMDESDTTQVFVHPTMSCNLDLAKEIGYNPDYRAGEDADILWSLARKNHGKWIKDALIGYVEEREINLPKSISSNIAQFKIARQLFHKGILDIGTQAYARMCLWWSLKLIVLQTLRIYPPLFMKTVNRRRLGEADQNFKPDSQKLDFLAEVCEREKTSNWSVSELKQEHREVSSIS